GQAGAARAPSAHRSTALARRQFLDFAVVSDLGSRRSRDDETRLLADPGFDLGCERHILDQEFAGIVLALAEAVVFVDGPGAQAPQHAVNHAELENLTLARDALPVQDVEVSRAERRRDFVLDDLDARFRADDLVAFLDRADAPDVHAHRRIELQRV